MCTIEEARIYLEDPFTEACVSHAHNYIIPPRRGGNRPAGIMRLGFLSLSFPHFHNPFKPIPSNHCCLTFPARLPFVSVDLNAV